MKEASGSGKLWYIFKIPGAYIREKYEHVNMLIKSPGASIFSRLEIYEKRGFRI